MQCRWCITAPRAVAAWLRRRPSPGPAAGPVTPPPPRPARPGGGRPPAGAGPAPPPRAAARPPPPRAARRASSTRASSLTFPDSPPRAGAPLSSRGLQRTTLSGGVQNATQRCELPSPAVAVRNLVEQAQHAHLCTVMSAMHHRRRGYPFGTIVEFAADGAGSPLFGFSPLAIHTRNLREDPRASLVLQLPGWTGLANARVTIFGDVYPLPKNMQEAAREIFHQKHAAQQAGSAPAPRRLSGNRQYFRMHRVRDIYFVGGFGTVQWVGPEEYAAAEPDRIIMERPRDTLRALNERFGDELRGLYGDRGLADDAALISIDRLGADVRVRFAGEHSVERLVFDKVYIRGWCLVGCLRVRFCRWETDSGEYLSIRDFQSPTVEIYHTEQLLSSFLQHGSSRTHTSSLYPSREWRRWRTRWTSSSA